MSELKLYRVPSSMTPLFPEKDGELRELAAELLKNSAKLTGSFNPVTRLAIAKLIEPMNSYYSNLIEGHFTHPLDIEKALKKDYSKEPKKKLLQLESQAHVIVNHSMKEKLTSMDDAYTWEFISWLHKSFYDHMPIEFRTVKDKGGNDILLVPGNKRITEVEVGNHIAPAAESLDVFLKFFEDGYSRKKISDPLQRIIAIAASHHRLAWIHPFLDGNGRVVRLFSEAACIIEKIDGEGLWSISRGLAVNNKDYYSALRNADMKRWNDYDGHGNLSDKFLIEFCSFFLKSAIDQTNFMLSLLEPEKLTSRIKEFVDLMVTRGEIRKESIYILEEALFKGKVSKGDMERLTGKSENLARGIMKDLLDKELLVNESSELRSPVMINFPIRYAPYIFPKLFPKDVEATMGD
ncbi:MAG: Fic family protein [Bacteroidetes bacterium]|nr:Fic family protein [Bacteroidota bacterium]